MAAESTDIFSLLANTNKGTYLQYMNNFSRILPCRVTNCPRESVKTAVFSVFGTYFVF